MGLEELFGLSSRPGSVETAVRKREVRSALQGVLLRSGPATEGLLVLNSLSKRSNLAGYRAGLVAGDPALVAELLQVRKHAGMIVPSPVQAAMTVALTDDAHVAEQKERYARRRDHLLSALLDAGFSVEHSEAGLYLWASRNEPCWRSIPTKRAPGRRSGRSTF